MAKGSGMTRSIISNYGRQKEFSRIERQITNYAEEAMHQHQTEDDIRKFDKKRLKQLIRIGKTYTDGQLKKTIQEAIDYDKERIKMSDASKSEINRISNLKTIHDNIPIYQKILREKRSGKK